MDTSRGGGAEPPRQDRPAEDRQGTRRLMMGGAVAAVVVGVGLLAWMVFGQFDAQQSTTDATGPRFGQQEGTSEAGRTQKPPSARIGAAPDPITVGRNEAISATASDRISLAPAQRKAIRDYVAARPEVRAASVPFTVAVGATVPRQISLHDVSPGLDQALPEYRGDLFLVVGDRLVVVEHGTRRMVAIVPDVLSDGG